MVSECQTFDWKPWLGEAEGSELISHPGPAEGGGGALPGSFHPSQPGFGLGVLVCGSK